MNNLQYELKAVRTSLNLTTKQCAELLGVSEITFQRWEGQTSFKKSMPFAYWELFLLKTGIHPTHELKQKK